MLREQSGAAHDMGTVGKCARRGLTDEVLHDHVSVLYKKPESAPHSELRPRACAVAADVGAPRRKGPFPSRRLAADEYHRAVLVRILREPDRAPRVACDGGLRCCLGRRWCSRGSPICVWAREREREREGRREVCRDRRARSAFCRALCGRRRRRRRRRPRSRAGGRAARARLCRRGRS